MRKTFLSITATMLFSPAFGQGAADETVTKEGDKIIFTKGKLTEHEPYLLNGKKVVADLPESDSAFHVISGAIMPIIKETMLKIGKGSYCIDINNILINEKGRVVFYEAQAPWASSCTAPLRNGTPLTEEQSLQFKNALDKTLMGMTVFAVTKDGANVPYLHRAISGDLTVNE